jgi:putative membrane protein
MERKDSLRRQVVGLTPNEQRTLILIIIGFHIIGIIGFFIPALNPLFRDLVPFHLVLMLALVAGSHRPADGFFFLFAAIIFVFGFIVEWIGVHTELLFGHYSYGYTLGTKVDDIPLCVAVNWILLIYSTGVCMKLTRVRNIYARIFTGAALLVVLDVIIEPVAIKFDYWRWASGTIPFKNYICWFIISALMLYIFEQFRFKKQSMVAPVFLLVQFIFFMVLYVGFMWF